ncbi:MAG: UDP-N-acetylmuramate:L-alanyl-gamma-D-glutamyl-meso-diaminopimelate ligase [Opitutae bacterium]|nr:UDP-N-acetylmuramate:L-alanyl-gamma-D-glutamyl-meso-diaminopimelate ligase [Opitutae bacterium]
MHKIAGVMHIYFMGICGTAMGNAALLMKELGHEVSGSDKGIYPPMSDLLVNSGIKIYDGYSAERLLFLRPDLVVVGNVISRGNPEIEWLLESRAFEYVSLPELLKTQLLKSRRNIVVSGTHGKTTTSSIAAFLLREHGDKPGWLIGGVPRDLSAGASAGEPAKPFVIEGDEYDTAFFDKRSKFVQYLPEILLINNIEFDHADIFRDLADVKRAFSHVARLVPRNGCVVANGDDDNVAEILAKITWTPILRVGVGENCDVRIRDFAETAAGSEFALTWKGRDWGKVAWSQSGIFNARNAAMAATACAVFCAGDKAEWEFPLGALAKFQGVKRRREILVDTPKLVVVEDFGHHPTAIRLTLAALRQRYPSRKLVCAFEPRSNTAVRRVLQNDFANALATADAVFIAPIFRPERFRAGEALDTATVAENLRSRGIEAHAPTTIDELLEMVEATADKASEREPAVVVFFSNGAFGGIIKKFANLYRPLF